MVTIKFIASHLRNASCKLQFSEWILLKLTLSQIVSVGVGTLYLVIFNFFVHEQGWQLLKSNDAWCNITWLKGHRLVGLKMDAHLTEVLKYYNQPCIKNANVTMREREWSIQ